MAESAILTIEDRSAGGLKRVARTDELGARGAWPSALRRYFAASVVGNLIWEFAQLPLYTIWHQGSAREIAFAAIHCTGGDVLIAGTALITALMIFGNASWPRGRFHVVASVTILGGLAYTIFSEWLNTEIRGSWAYSEWMPTLPLIGAGLSPFAQWIIVPVIALWWSRRPFVAVAEQERRNL
jgi:hypothetical protein